MAAAWPIQHDKCHREGDRSFKGLKFLLCARLCTQLTVSTLTNEALTLRIAAAPRAGQRASFGIASTSRTAGQLEDRKVVAAVLEQRGLRRMSTGAGDDKATGHLTRYISIYIYMVGHADRGGLGDVRVLEQAVRQLE